MKYVAAKANTQNVQEKTCHAHNNMNNPNNPVPADAGQPDVGMMVDDDGSGFVEDIVEEVVEGPCLANMTLIEDAPALGPFCIDKFEASRSDATDVSQGANNGGATSRSNVLPWTGLDTAGAQTACESSGKRLCSLEEWTAACGGPDSRKYPYSAIQYVVGMCNTSGTLEPTGTRPDCVFEAYETFDMSGNAAEIVSTGLGGVSLKGGSFGNTAPTQLTCDGEPVNQAPIGQIGFRCCKTP